ncbi:MAG: HAD-IIIC family phosphatase [Bacillota bacterium]
MFNFDAFRLDEIVSSDSIDIEEISSKDIAIIGMSARLPKAENVKEFWHNIRSAVDCVEDYPEARKKDSDAFLRYIGTDEEKIKYTKGAYLTDVDKFDYSFFQITPKEASLMNPNQRVFLETVWNAIEDSGYGGKKLRGSNTGVYMGYSPGTFVDVLYDYSRFIIEVDPFLAPMAVPGNLHSIIASRISYVLDLKGPSLSIDTACSSSLVAVHLACQGIRNGECDMAIAGSVKINLFPLDREQKLGIESSNAKARTFDESSDGTGRGEGVVAIILKPLSNAVKDGDHIYAVIKGSAINQDGNSIGITAPNAVAQTNVICSAWENAAINPEAIGYIEAHGTGTKLGDPIEIEGIRNAFNKYTQKKQFCAIGSVKSNIGHLDSCAGIVGLIKAVLALQHREIPPTLHFEYPNKKIEFENSPVYVNNELTEWEYEGFPRTAGVSAFGLSGTNCHIVLEEAPVENDNMELNNNDAYILTISAKSRGSLNELVNQYYNYANNNSSLDLSSICYTSNTGRGHYNYRIAMVLKDGNDMREKIQYLKENGLKSYEDNKIYFGEIRLSSENKNLSGNIVEITEEKLKRLNESAAKIIDECIEAKQRFDIFDELCKVYISGADLEWEKLYIGDKRKRVPIPVYPFERVRCWLEVNNKVKRRKIVEEIGLEEDVRSIRLTGKESGNYPQTEVKVAQVWAEIMGFEEIDVNGNFYELGGDSIIAMRIVNSVDRLFNVKVDITEIMRFPTIREFSHVLETKYLCSEKSPKLDQAIIPVGNKEYYQTSVVQKMIYAQVQSKDTGIALNMPLAIEITGELDRKKLEDTFKKLVERHEAFRTYFSFVNGNIVQIVHDDISFNIEYLEAAEEDIDNIAKAFIKPFDLSKAPLFRILLVNTSERKHILLMDMHHIISDGASLDILIKEFVQIYESKSLPELTIQYKDFVIWQDEYLRSHKIEKQKEYWQEVLRDKIPELFLPLDYKRPDSRSYDGKTIQFKIKNDIAEKLADLAKRSGITLNTVLFAAYSLLLSKYSRQEDVIVGTAVSGRNHYQLQNIVGAFLNLLPIRNKINPEFTITDLVRSYNEVLIGAYENQDYPYTSMIEACNIKTEKSKNPIFDTTLIYHNEYDPNISFSSSGLMLSTYALTTNTAKLDIKLDIFSELSGELLCLMEYNTSLFKEDTITTFIKHFNILLEDLINNPLKKINEIKLFTEEEKNQIEEKAMKNSYNSVKQDNLSLVISATFTSEPIHDHIKWWGNQFDTDIDIQFTSYNQIFMELLEPSSLISTNKGVNLLLVRFEDWIRDSKSDDDEAKCEKLQRNFDELTAILAQKQKNIPYFIGIFPVSTHLSLSSRVKEYIEALNTSWAKLLGGMENVYTIDFTGISNLYNIRQVFDQIKDSEGHIPFTDEFYAAMGMMVIRKIHSWRRQDFKVIVLDCDNTLWKGICGEDGALGVKVAEPYKELQRFMVNKYNEGMLLTLCSKNNEEDVWEVFENNPDMLLKKEHFVNWKINWNAKSQNIKEMAYELNLGEDSFIFIDDNFAECSEVMTNCPKVLSLHLPDDFMQIPAYLKHVWAFDRFIVTDEDTKRTSMYASEKRRQEFQKDTLTLNGFLKGLELKMSMSEVENSQIPRVAQLTHRTNQFNMSTIRRTEEDIESLMHMDNVRLWAIDVSDRFGDYGLVGLVIAKEEGKKLFIDTFLLSCRVLGRCVEDAILAGLRKHCMESGIDSIEAKFYPTSKNQPFISFIERSGWKRLGETSEYILFSLPIGTLPERIDVIECYYNCKFKKEDKTSYNNDIKAVDFVASNIKPADQDISQVDAKTWDVGVANEENLLHKKYLLPLKYHNGNVLIDLPKKEIINRDAAKTEYVEPTTEAEIKIAQIWKEVLGIDKVSINDKFTDLGGTSMDGIQIVSRMALDFDAHLNDIFKYDTIAALAKNIPFKDNQLRLNLDKMAALTKTSQGNNYSDDEEIQSKTKLYNQMNEKYKDVDLAEVRDYKNILLTGSTGYLGAHLLFELLHNTESNIHLLVRGATQNDAEFRLKQKLEFYFNDISYEQYKARVFIYNSDIGKDLMGLTKETYEYLVANIDCIINSAANVRHYGKYEEFHEVNVKGIERLIEFALQGERKDLHHISTPLVGHGKVEGKYDLLFTEYDHDVGQIDENVYTKSKLEGEKLLVQARGKGLNSNIYRVGNLVYNTTTQKFQENINDNAFYTLLKSFIKLNMIPGVDKKVLDFSFVDYVSKAVILLFNRSNLLNETYHLYNYNRISSIDLGKLLGMVGYSQLQITTVEEFFNFAYENYEHPELKEYVLNVLVHGYIMGDLNDTNFHLICDKSKIILDRIGFKWSEVDKMHLERMVEYCREVGFI